MGRYTAVLKASAALFSLSKTKREETVLLSSILSFFTENDYGQTGQRDRFIGSAAVTQL